MRRLLLALLLLAGCTTTVTENPDGTTTIETHTDVAEGAVWAAMLSQYGQQAWEQWTRYQALQDERNAAQDAERRAELQGQIDAILRGLELLEGGS